MPMCITPCFEFELHHSRPLQISVTLNLIYLIYLSYSYPTTEKRLPEPIQRTVTCSRTKPEPIRCRFSISTAYQRIARDCDVIVSYLLELQEVAMFLPPEGRRTSRRMRIRHEVKGASGERWTEKSMGGD